MDEPKSKFNLARAWKLDKGEDEHPVKKRTLDLRAQDTSVRLVRGTFMNRARRRAEAKRVGR